MFVFCPNCPCLQLFLVTYRFLVFCCLRRHLSRGNRCSKGSQIPGSSCCYVHHLSAVPPHLSHTYFELLLLPFHDSLLAFFLSTSSLKEFFLVLIGDAKMSRKFFSGLAVDNFHNYTPPLKLPYWFYSLIGFMVLSFHFCYNFGTCQQTRCVASLGSVHLHNCDIFYLS